MQNVYDCVYKLGTGSSNSIRSIAVAAFNIETLLNLETWA